MEKEILIPGQHGHEVIVPMDSDWKKALSAFLLNLDAKEATKRQYGKAMMLFFKWTETNGLPISEIARSHILAYRKELLEGERKLSSQTVAAYIVAIRRFYAWAESEKLYPNIARGVSSPKIRKDFVKQHLTQEECRDMLQKLFADIDEKIHARTFANSRENGLRDYAMVNLILRTGLRTIEVSRLDVGDITQRRRKNVILVWGKGRDTKDDYVPLSEKAYTPICDYLEMRGNPEPDEPLFICEGYGSRGRRLSPRRIQAICKEALRDIGLDGHEFSAHSLRHTCAVMLIQAGASAYDVQKFLRHSSIDVTEIYLRSIEEDLRLGRAPEALLDRAF